MVSVPDSPDRYSRVNYRRLIAWETRIEREWPLLREVLSSGPSRRLLDLGCGSGEHSRFLADKGFEVVGVDASESMLRLAREQMVPAGVSFVAGDIRDLGNTVTGPFGGAICLGNTLPHLQCPEDLLRLAQGLRLCLDRGAPLLLQSLNYDRILTQGIRQLPINFQSPHEDETGEIVFVRLMTPRPDGTVVFMPSTLLYHPGEEPPLELVSSREIELRGWRQKEVDAAFAQAAFDERRFYGSFARENFDADESQDLVAVLR